MKNWLASELLKTFPESDVMIEVSCGDGKNCLISADQIEYNDVTRQAILKGSVQTN